MVYKQLRDSNWRIPYTGGWCLKYVQDAFKTDHVYATAGKAWKANYKNGNHPGQLPPKGVTVPVYFDLGSSTNEHVAIHLSDGYVASTTQAGKHPKGYLHKDLNDIIAVYAKYNKGCKYLGWSEYVGTVHVVQEVPTAAEKAAAAKALAAAKARAAEAKAKADAEAKAKALAEAQAVAKVKAESDAKQKIIDEQTAAQAVTADIHNTVKANNVLLQKILDFLMSIFKVKGE